MAMEMEKNKEVIKYSSRINKKAKKNGSKKIETSPETRRVKIKKNGRRCLNLKRGIPNFKG